MVAVCCRVKHLLSKLFFITWAYVATEVQKHSQSSVKSQPQVSYKQFS